jgi:hypothetical protein
MEQQKVDMFMATNGSKFPEEKQMLVREMFANADDNKFNIALAQDYKDPNTILIVAVVGGTLGIDRFMLGDTGLAVLKLITSGGCGIWAIIDWFTATKRAKDHNFLKLQQVMM